MEQERVVENIDDVDERQSHTSDHGSMAVNIARTELDEREQVENDADNDSNSSSSEAEGSDASSEYTEVDLTQNEMYQVLSTFLESSEGYNLCDILLALKNSIEENNHLLRYALTRNVTDEN